MLFAFRTQMPSPLRKLSPTAVRKFSEIFSSRRVSGFSLSITTGPECPLRGTHVPSPTAARPGRGWEKLIYLPLAFLITHAVLVPKIINPLIMGHPVRGVFHKPPSWSLLTVFSRRSFTEANHSVADSMTLTK